MNDRIDITTATMNNSSFQEIISPWMIIFPIKVTVPINSVKRTATIYFELTISFLV